jgi:hypothetical protein
MRHGTFGRLRHVRVEPPIPTAGVKQIAKICPIDLGTACLRMATQSEFVYN